MYFPTSSILIEFLILAIIDREDSYGYEISQTISLWLISRSQHFILF